MRCRHARDDFYVPSPQGRKKKPYKVCKRQKGNAALSVCLSISPNFGASSPTSTFYPQVSANTSRSIYPFF